MRKIIDHEEDRQGILVPCVLNLELCIDDSAPDEDAIIIINFCFSLFIKITIVQVVYVCVR